MGLSDKLPEIRLKSRWIRDPVRQRAFSQDYRCVRERQQGDDVPEISRMVSVEKTLMHAGMPTLHALLSRKPAHDPVIPVWTPSFSRVYDTLIAIDKQNETRSASTAN